MVFDELQRIQVELQSAVEKGWVLWNHSNSASELIKVQLLNIDSVDVNATFKDLDNSAHAKADGALASSSSANDTHFLTLFDFVSNSIQNYICVRTIPQFDSPELNSPMLRPVWSILEVVRTFFEVNFSFMLDLSHLKAPVNVDHLLFNAHVPLEKVHQSKLDVQRVVQHQTQKHRVY